VRVPWGLAGGSEGYIPRNPQETPRKPPGNPEQIHQDFTLYLKRNYSKIHWIGIEKKYKKIQSECLHSFRKTLISLHNISGRAFFLNTIKKQLSVTKLTAES